MAIEFIDSKTLNEDELSVAQRVVTAHSKKMERLLPGHKLVVKFSKKDVTGKRARYVIRCRIDCPSCIASAQAEDWELARTLHKVLDKIDHELEHKFKKNSQHKPFGKESKRKREKAER